MLELMPPPADASLGAAPTNGKRRIPGIRSTTRKRPTVQHGHCNTAIRATRVMNSLADSLACALGHGICNASRA
jgi:hypothetical protein